MDENNKKEQQGNEQQQPKQQQQQLTFNQLEQVEADRALAFALQQQESAFTMIETIGGEMDDEEEDEEEEDEEEEIGSSSSHDFDGNFESQEFEAEFEFTVDDDEGSYIDDEFEEDDVDPDEMSYEELMALGEIVGEESRGLPVEQIPSCLSPCVHKFVQCKTIIDRCVICQVEYEEGEQLAGLQCQHPFHGECINQWLQIKKVCPICSTEVAPQPQSNPDKK